jgi:hypothetical protein
VGGDGKHKQTTREVSEICQPGLSNTGSGRGINLIFINPLETDQESYCELEVGYEKAVDENHVLVLADSNPVTSPSCDEQVSYIGEQGGGCDCGK